MNGDAFSRANALGPGSMLRSYRSAATAIGTGRAYADLVREQAPLDLAGIDAGLAITVAAHQNEIDGQAAEFCDTVVADFIRLASDVGNYVDLIASFGDAVTLRQLADERRWDGVREKLGAIADVAGENGVDGDTAVDHIATVRDEVRRSGKRLDAVLARAVGALDAEGKAAAAQIDTLTAKISDSIQRIVDGANETGDAVTTLGIGVLTMLTKDSKPPASPTDDETEDEDEEGADEAPASDESPAADADADADADDPADGDDDPADGDGDDDPTDGEDDPADEDEDDDEDVDDDAASTKNSSSGKVPDVSFVVSAIKAGEKGTQKFASAIATLNTSNDRLAVQYQRLAASDRLVAVAKATQAQKTLFATSVSDTATAIDTIRQEWASVQRSVASWSTKTSPEDAAALAALVPAAMKQWQAVASELEQIKRALTRARRAR